jgi:hypothetical protein
VLVLVSCRSTADMVVSPPTPNPLPLLLIVRTCRVCCVQVEFGLPELEGRTHIFKIHTKTMSVDKDIRYELIARLCPSSTGAEIRWGGALSRWALCTLWGAGVPRTCFRKLRYRSMSFAAVQFPLWGLCPFPKCQ